MKWTDDAEDDVDVTLEWSDLSTPATEANRGTKRAGVQCLCGRFAHYLGGRHYYNGTFDCYSFDVECGRCGVVTVECV